MLTLLCFAPEGVGLDQAAIGRRLAEDPAVTLEGEPGDRYRPGAWRDPFLGTRAEIDWGDPPLGGGDEATLAERRYPDWQTVPLRFQVPLTGAHWRVLAFLRWLEGFLAEVPGLAVLDTEDVQAEGEVGPGPLDRERVLASWKRLRDNFDAGRHDLVRLDPERSRALWRYLEERRDASDADPARVWPTVVVIATDDGAARLGCLWRDPSQPLALPPVDLVVVTRDDEPGLIPADEVCTAAGDPPRSPGGTRMLDPSPALEHLHRGAHLVDPAGWRLCGDGDWVEEG